MVTTEIIERAQAGDRDALAVIFRAYHPAILRYLRAMALAHAEDVASQVWIDVARSLARFSGGVDDLPRWLFTIARRRMIDAFRSRTRRPEEATATPGDAAVNAPADAAIDRLDWAQEVLSRLAPAQAEVVMLRVVLGFDVDEVARMVDRSPGAVRVLAHRGLARLRDILTADGLAPTSVERITPDDEEILGERVTDAAAAAMVRLP